MRASYGHEKMTASDAWECYVGSQTPLEFMENSDGKTVKQACDEYAHEVEDGLMAPDDLPEDFDAAELSILMQQYIEIDKKYRAAKAVQA